MKRCKDAGPWAGRPRAQPMMKADEVRAMYSSSLHLGRTAPDTSASAVRDTPLNLELCPNPDQQYSQPALYPSQL